LFNALYDVKELPFITNAHNNDWHHSILPVCTVMSLQIDSKISSETSLASTLIQVKKEDVISFCKLDTKSDYFIVDGNLHGQGSGLAVLVIKSSVVFKLHSQLNA